MRSAIVTTVLFIFFLPQLQAQDSLRILSWNVKMLPGIAKGNNRRAKAIVEQIQKHSYDVIVFQETFQPRARNIIAKRLKVNYPYQTKVLNKKALALKTNGGVMVISRHPIGEVKEIRYSKREGIDRMARKGALLAEVDLGNRKVQIVGTHCRLLGPLKQCMHNIVSCTINYWPLMKNRVWHKLFVETLTRSKNCHLNCRHLLHNQWLSVWRAMM